MNKVKTLKITLLFLIVVNLVLGVTGYYTSTVKNDNKDNNKDPDLNYKISMIYYLNGTQKLSEMPTNPQNEVLYKFEKYVCTNNVKGIWNDQKWEFNVNKTTDAVCKLYFISAIYNLNVSAINGTLESDSIMKVDSNTDGIFIVKANEGYAYDKTICTNEEETLWDEIKNEVTVKDVKADTSCEVTFKLKEYTVVFDVKNGKNITNQIVKHSQNLTVTITPSSGFNNPTITCNNTDLGQSVTPGTWTNNNYTMNLITSNLKCVFEFKPIVIAPTIYQITFLEKFDDGRADSLTIKDVEEGQSTTHPVTVGYKIKSTDDCVNEETTTSVTVKNVTKSKTCTIHVTKID